MQATSQCSPSFRSRPWRALLCMLTVAAITLASPALGAAAVPTASTDMCVGLECDLPASGFYVPEAQGSLSSVGSLDELEAQKQSGFFRIPALVYRGDARPEAVVYLAKAGTIDQMPESVAQLPAVRDFVKEGRAATDANDLVVIDHGMRLVMPNKPVATAAFTDPSGRCDPRYFCVFEYESYDGGIYALSGVLYWGTGWHNFGTNTGSSQVNNRAGDSLLADHSMGTGTRYCAQQYSFDTTFSNNPLGNWAASSWALLGSTPDRC